MRMMFIFSALVIFSNQVFAGQVCFSESKDQVENGYLPVLVTDTATKKPKFDCVSSAIKGANLTFDIRVRNKTSTDPGIEKKSVYFWDSQSCDVAKTFLENCFDKRDYNCVVLDDGLIAGTVGVLQSDCYARQNAVITINAAAREMLAKKTNTGDVDEKNAGVESGSKMQKFVKPEDRKDVEQAQDSDSNSALELLEDAAENIKTRKAQ